jgi:hypothetical protein
MVVEGVGNVANKFLDLGFFKLALGYHYAYNSLKGCFGELHPVMNLLDTCPQACLFINFLRYGEILDSCLKILHVILYIATIDEEIWILC